VSVRIAEGREGEGGGEGRGGRCVRVDALFTALADGKNRVRGVNADAGRRPDGNFPPKSSFMTSLLQTECICCFKLSVTCQKCIEIMKS
jgi:hypothetical protein